MGYEAEMKEEERAIRQESKHPFHIGVITEIDLVLWQKQKQKYEEEDWRNFEWMELYRLQNIAVNK